MSQTCALSGQSVHEFTICWASRVAHSIATICLFSSRNRNRLIPPLSVHYQKVHSSCVSIFAALFLSSEKLAPIFLTILTHWINPLVHTPSPGTAAAPSFAWLPSSFYPCWHRRTKGPCQHREHTLPGRIPVWMPSSPPLQHESCGCAPFPNNTPPLQCT